MSSTLHGTVFVSRFFKEGIRYDEVKGVETSLPWLVSLEGQETRRQANAEKRHKTRKEGIYKTWQDEMDADATLILNFRPSGLERK